MRAHSDARSKSKYLAHFPVQGDFRAPGMDVTTRMQKKKKKKKKYRTTAYAIVWQGTAVQTKALSMPLSRVQQLPTSHHNTPITTQ